MCSNRVVDNLECYMDELVECFKDFVKKSLMLMFLGIGIIVGLLCYLLRMVSERPLLNNAVVENITRTQNKVNYLISSRKVEKEVNENMSNKLKENDYMKTKEIDNNITPHKEIDKDKTTPAINTSDIPNIDDNLLRDLSLLSCSKYGGCCGSNTHIPSRVPVPSLSTSSSKHKLIPCLRKRSLNKSSSSIPSLQICPKINKPGSCCSACCNDEQKANEDLDRQMIYENKY